MAISSIEHYKRLYHKLRETAKSKVITGLATEKLNGNAIYPNQWPPSGQMMVAVDFNPRAGIPFTQALRVATIEGPDRRCATGVFLFSVSGR